MQGLKAVEIFSIGKWRGNRTVEATMAMLDRMVANYHDLNAKIEGFSIPVKLGHNNKVGEPAYGYATNVRREDTKLLADFADVPPDLIDMVNKRQYNSVSVEIWPKVEYAGQVFNDVLGAVAFLGSEWPAVKGLKPLSASLFSDSEGEWIEKEDQMANPTTFTEDQHATLLTAAIEKTKAETAATFQAQITELTGKVTASDERADRAEAALKVFKNDAAKATVLSIVEKAIADGRILPKQKDEIMAMAEHYGVMSSAKFKVGEVEKTGLEMFQSFLEGLPIKVQYGERGHSKGEKPGDGERADKIVDEKAKALMSADKKLKYADAVEKVLKDDPALKATYFSQRVEA